jgi:dehydrogenase/reductase SDR family member 1
VTEITDRNEAKRNLRNTVALVTGGSRGLGKGIAVQLAKHGAIVYITARNKSQATVDVPGTADQTVAEIEAFGGRAIAVSCDQRDDDQVAAVFAHIAREQDRLDILVNCAMATIEGMGGNGPFFGGVPFWQAPLDSWDIATNVGLRSHYIATVLAMPLLIASHGLVVNISSAGAETYYLSVPYGVQKAGTDRMIRDMAYEAADQPVTFVALWPGFAATELTAGLDEASLEVARNAARRAKLDMRRRNGVPAPETTFEVKPESQFFPGMAVAALAADPNVRRWNGRSVSTIGCALTYGYTDVDGSLPDSFGLADAEVWPMVAMK